jgi:hypothetical protein
MFRLIQVHADDGNPRIHADRDGYANEHAALTGFRETSIAYLGVGRFDERGDLAEIIVDTFCGPVGECPRPATVVHAVTFRRLCDTCSFGMHVLSLDELSTRLGVAVRRAAVLARAGRHARPDDSCALSNRIARELATHIHDPDWQADVCAELTHTPEAVNGLLIGVGALSHRDVLDLYPALRDLSVRLPVCIQADLLRASARPLSPGGVTALRLGL